MLLDGFVSTCVQRVNSDFIHPQTLCHCPCLGYLYLHLHLYFFIHPQTLCQCPCLCLGYLLQRPPVAFLSQAATALPTLLEHILKKYIFYLNCLLFSFFFCRHCTPNPPSLGVLEHNAFLILYCSWGVMDMDNGALGSFFTNSFIDFLPWKMVGYKTRPKFCPMMR